MQFSSRHIWGEYPKIGHCRFLPHTFTAIQQFDATSSMLLKGHH